ncbi:hypothetical protein SMICM17S_12641 [Streptomyces microflavus]
MQTRPTSSSIWAGVPTKSAGKRPEDGSAVSRFTASGPNSFTHQVIHLSTHSWSLGGTGHRSSSSERAQGFTLGGTTARFGVRRRRPRQIRAHRDGVRLILGAPAPRSLRLLRF